MSDFWTAQKSVAELEEKLKQAKTVLEEATKAISTDPTIILAEALHKSFCHHNHTDGCDWHYGTWETPSYAKKRYLASAQKIKPMLDVISDDPHEQATWLLNLVRAARGF